MNNDDTQRSLSSRVLELQRAINDLAAEYFEENRRQAAQEERFRRMAEMLQELRKIRQLGQGAGCAIPETLSAEAEDVRAAIARHTSFLSGESTPPADCSAN